MFGWPGIFHIAQQVSEQKLAAGWDAEKRSIDDFVTEFAVVWVALRAPAVRWFQRLIIGWPGDVNH